VTAKEWKKKEIHQLWNLTGIGIEQRGLFTKHTMVRSEGKKSRAVWSGLPTALLPELDRFHLFPVPMLLLLLMQLFNLP